MSDFVVRTVVVMATSLFVLTLPKKLRLPLMLLLLLLLLQIELLTTLGSYFSCFSRLNWERFCVGSFYLIGTKFTLTQLGFFNTKAQKHHFPCNTGGATYGPRATSGPRSAKFQLNVGFVYKKFGPRDI